MPGNFCSRAKQHSISITERGAHTFIVSQVKSILLTSSSICSHFVHSSSKFVSSAKSAIFDKTVGLLPNILRTLSEDYTENWPNFLCKSGNWDKVSAGEEVTPEAMNRSIARLAGIVSVFSRGFRSTSSLTMPIKVRFSGFFSFVAWELLMCSFLRCATCTRGTARNLRQFAGKFSTPISHFSNVFSLVVSFSCSWSAD